ncbi:MAG TPA: SIR2 family protein, partial [Polyangiaceae bacterium]|nr:SIR2 family protein [Polyangiaceae bacterium]
DLLELALERVAASRVAAIYSTRRRAADGPRVVHLHGYFPWKPGAGEDERDLARTVVASESDYHLLSNDHVAWTNRELLSLLETRSTLIVGTSLADPNLRRLLSHLSQQRAHASPTGRHERHYVVMQSRDADAAADRLVARAQAILGHEIDGEDQLRAVRRLAALASKILEKNEREFWDAQGVKIINVESYERLGYLLRRIRFGDEDWDEAHRRMRAAWAARNYGEQDFDDPVLQDLCTELLAEARDQITKVGQPVRVHGEVQINVFLPLVDGSYRRAFASTPGRASAAPRRFKARHDRFTLPDVERVLTLGSPVTSPKVATRLPPPGEPPFSTWYRSIEGVPYFDYESGGIPVAVIQLCTSLEGGVGRDLDADGVTRLRGYLGSVVTGVLNTVRRYRGEP